MSDGVRFRLNRLLILMAVVAILGGLLLDGWSFTLRNALLLCLACIGVG